MVKFGMMSFVPANLIKVLTSAPEGVVTAIYLYKGHATGTIVFASVPSLRRLKV